MTRRGRAVFPAVVLLTTACATTRFDRYMGQQRWSDAAGAFAADTSLRRDDHALYRAGLLFGTPSRPTYDPVRAHDVLSALLARFPDSAYRRDAAERLALIDDVLRARQDAAARRQELEAKIATISAETRLLNFRLDSALAQRDSLRGTVGRLESERRERDDQLRALHLELQRLKEIDLKPRTTAPAIKPK